MQPRKVRHTAAILTVTIASGLLFSISSLNERKNPAGTSDLTTLVHTRQAQVAALDAEVGARDAQIQNFSTSQPGAPTPDEDTMNALWAGGAEAMTVQGVRITNRTVIRCIGNVILVDRTSFSPPFVIQAIGDPDTLRATVTANPRMVNYQAYVSKYGLGWDMQTKDSLSFAPATTSLTVNYATVEETNG